MPAPVITLPINQEGSSLVLDAEQLELDLNGVFEALYDTIPEEGPQGPPGSPGAPGAAGQSAYQIAVANGFVGTLTQWLASLVGAQGPQGIQGNTGPQGTQGNPGAQGAQGPQGIQGDAGVNVTITTVTTQSAFDAATPTATQLVVLVSA